MLEEKDKTLQNTLSGTSSGLKMRNTAEAQLRRKVVELNKRYGDAKKIAKALFLVDGYKADEIQGEQEQYDAIMSGQPMPKGGEEGRLEDRQRNVMHDHITARMNEKDEDTYGEIDELMFDPTDKGDIASLVRDMAIEYPDISYGEIKGAVYERVGQLSQDTVVEETTPEETTENQEQGDGFWKSKFRGFFGVDEDVFQPPQQQPPQQPQQEQYPEGQPQKNPSGIYPQQQVKGARMDSFIQGVEDRFSETKTYDNTMAEPPGLNGMGTVAPNQPPPAEERYPGGVVESWDKPNDVSGLPIEEGKKTYEQSRMELKDVDILSKDYKPRTPNQVPQSEIESYKQKIREVFGDEADLAIQVMLEESKGIPEDVGDKDKTFDYKGEKIGDSVGLFQIRTGGKNWPTTKSRAEAEGVSLSEFRNNMLDPDQNIRYAKYLVDKEGWQLWSTYNTAKKKLNK